MSARDDFYIGYHESAPPSLASWLRARVALLLVGSAAIAVALVATMSGFSSSVFEFGVVRNFEGLVVEHPYPTLLVPRPGAQEGSPSSYLLVAFGKHGAGEAVRGHDGAFVRLSGSLIHHEGQTMIELLDGSLERLEESGGALPEEIERGEETLVGEIVDSKCFFGVMKPGYAKPHRACATLCIRGGVPPALLVRAADGSALTYLLVSEEGEAVNEAVLPYVAEPISIRGRVVERGALRFLYADPASYRRR